MSSNQDRRIDIWKECLIWLLLILVSAFAMYPVLADPIGKVVGFTGDNIQYLYMVGWMAKALQSGNSPFIDYNLNYPDGLPMAATDTPFLGILAMAPLTWIVNEIFSYNLLIFLSYFLSGLFTYLWIRRLTGSRFAGILAGLVFLLTPYRVAHSYGHLNLVSTQFIPVFFWALDNIIIDNQPSIKKLTALLMATFLVGATSQYYLVICLTCGIIYVLFSRLEWRYLILHGWKIVLSVLAGGLISSLPYLAIRNVVSFESYKITTTRIWSTSLTDYLLPSRLHMIWGSWIEDTFKVPYWIEHTAYIGIVAGILALMALLWGDDKFKHYRKVWSATLLFAFIMSLGTDLHLFLGKPMMPENPVWLPAYYFGQLPFLALMRAWSRYSIVVVLMVSLLAGLGAKRLERNGQLHPAWKIIILGLIILDFLPGRLDASQITHRPIDAWLAAQPGEFAVGFISTDVMSNYFNIYGSLLHDKKMPAYIHPEHRPRAYERYFRAIQDFPQKPSINTLRRMDIRFIVVRPGEFDGIDKPSWQSVESQLNSYPDLIKVAEVNGELIYELKQ